MHLPTYNFEQFRQYCFSFGQGSLPLLIVVGSPGLSKSRTMAEACPEARIIQGGNLSAFGFYLELYQYKNQPIIIDDIDALYTNRDSVRLLKCVCQTEPTKVCGWHTASKKLPQDNFGNPIKEFKTTSHIAIIANEWKSLNKNVEALADRGHLLSFDPSASEVHENVCGWFKDQEILDYFEEHLGDIHNPSMRTYKAALDLKNAGHDWKTPLLQTWQKPIPEELAIMKLANMKMGEEDKVNLFCRWTGASRATYYRKVKALATKITMKAAPREDDLMR